MISHLLKRPAIALVFATSFFLCQGVCQAEPSVDERIQGLLGQLAVNSKNEKARLELAILLQKNGYEDLAAEQMNELEKVRPGTFVEEFRKSVLGDNEFSSRFLGYGQTYFSNDPWVLFIGARGLRYHNRYKESKELLAHLLKSDKFVPGMYSLAADIALQEERWSEALHFANLELKNNPDSREALQYKIWSKNMMGQSLASEQQNIENLYRKKRTASDMGVLYGDRLVRQRKYVEALEPCLFGVYCNSSKVTQSMNHKNLTQIVSTMSDNELANYVGRFMMAFKPEPLIVAMTYMKLGEALMAAGRYEAAELYLNENLKITPFFSLQSYLDLAAIKQHQNDYTTAYKLFERAISMDPSNKEVRKKFDAFYSAYERHGVRTKTNRDVAWRLKNAMQSENPRQAQPLSAR